MSNKVKKPFYKRWWFILLVAFFVLGGIGSQGDSEETVSEEPTATSTPVAQAEDTNADAEEAVEVVEEVIEEPVYVNTAEKAELFSGTFVVGEDITPGRYVITCDSGNGNLFIYDNGMPLINEILAASAGDFGVSKVETDILSGQEIEISGLDKVNFTPSEVSLKTTLPAGIHLVGRDVPAGSYIATTKSGSGNFFVYGKSGLPEVNEILGAEDDGFSVTKVKFKVSDGEIIQIGGLESVTLQ